MTGFYRKHYAEDVTERPFLEVLYTDIASHLHFLITPFFSFHIIGELSACAFSTLGFEVVSGLCVNLSGKDW